DACDFFVEAGRQRGAAVLFGRRLLASRFASAQRLHSGVRITLRIFDAALYPAYEVADRRAGVDSECIGQSSADATTSLDRVHDRHIVRVGSAFESLDAPDDDFAGVEMRAALQSDELFAAYCEMFRETLFVERRN